jgi:hypothetical protein
VNKVVPFTEGILATGGEFAQFQPKDVIKLIIKAYQLAEVAKDRPIQINQAIDAALITTNMHHTTYGLKMADKGAFDPITKLPIYGSTDSCTLQSRNNCFPLMIVLKRETKELFSEFTTIMEDVYNQSTSGNQRSDTEYKPISTAFDSDMSATWKLCGKGGAMKREIYPCHCCAIHDENIAIPNPKKCSRWCMDLHKDDENWQCYHHDILDDKNIEILKSKLEKLHKDISHIIPTINVLVSSSSLNINEDPREITDINQAYDPMSIHFDYHNEEVDKETVLDFSGKISDELSRRGVIPKGSLDTRVNMLRDYLSQEWLLSSISTSIKHSEKCSDKFFLSLIDCVPCILHLENRTGLKIFSMILRESLNNAIEGNIFTVIMSEQS